MDEVRILCSIVKRRRTHGIKEVLMKIMIRLSSQCAFDHVLIHAIVNTSIYIMCYIVLYLV